MSGKMNLLQKLGLALVLASCALLLISEGVAAWNRRALVEITQQIRSGLPQRTEGDPESYSSTAMPVRQIRGRDFVALVEFPAYGVSLPVENQWDPANAAAHPCRFWGSAYDNSLIVGGVDRKGQLEICGQLDLGDKVLVTDMAGAQFSYEVVHIDRRSQVDEATMAEMDCDLILFARNSTVGNYILVRCRLAP